MRGLRRVSDNSLYFIFCLLLFPTSVGANIACFMLCLFPFPTSETVSHRLDVPILHTEQGTAVNYPFLLIGRFFVQITAISSKELLHKLINF
jgi:hypothetical protein